MKRIKLLSSIILFAGICGGFVFYCGKLPKSAPPANDSGNKPNTCYVKTIIKYSECSHSDACTLSIECTSPSFIGFSDNNSLLEVSSITTKDSMKMALFQKEPGTIPTNWYAANSSLSCTPSSKSAITCNHFAPLADHFILEGTVGEITVNLDVTIDKSGITRSVPYDFKDGSGANYAPYAKCGQMGAALADKAINYTIPQRAYDCSVRVTSYAAIGKANGDIIPFELGKDDPSNYWFLLGCPVDTDQNKNHEFCSWISPKILPTNPVITQNLQGDDPTSTKLEAGMRLVWSGLIAPFDSEKFKTFYQTNGTTEDGDANCDGNGKCAWYFNNGYKFDNPTPDYKAWQVFQSLEKMSDKKTTDAKNLPNFCDQQLKANNQNFSGAINTLYPWQVPDYVMLMTLTGGQKVDSPQLRFCEKNAESHANCLEGGFGRAINAIPAFHTNLMSSSLFSPNYIRYFKGASGYVEHAALTSTLGVRCVAPVSDL